MTTTVEYDLKDILIRIDSKLDRVTEDVNSLKIDIATIKAELSSVKSELKDVKSDLKDVKGTQKNQMWALIISSISVSVGLFGALAKIIFFN